MAVSGLGVPPGRTEPYALLHPELQLLLLALQEFHLTGQISSIPSKIGGPLMRALVSCANSKLELDRWAGQLQAREPGTGSTSLGSRRGHLPGAPFAPG